ncbi:hypothetical protein C8R43DRAFT_1138100 [Mycena crocata]|nr:hypothetical protein C8R43DRAFT_1138100 [Mycena crocata]
MSAFNHSTPAATASAAAAGASSPAVQQGLSLLAALGRAVDSLTVATSDLVDTPASGLAAALIVVDDAAAAVHSASAAVAAALTSGASFSAPAPAPAPATNIFPPIAPVVPAFLRSTAPWIAGLLYVVVPASPLTSVTDNNEKWFAITRGKYVGLTKNSAISLNAVSGVTTAISQKHATQREALDHFNAALLTGAVAVIE